MLNSNHPTPPVAQLSETQLEQVSGGRFKIPGTGIETYEVYYDDGITIWTNKPLCSNYFPNYS
jgi:hypothetical protein